MNDFDQLPEPMQLAIEVIRQLENLEYPPETILQGMLYVCKDTLNKLEGAEKEHWRTRFIEEIEQCGNP